MTVWGARQAHSALGRHLKLDRNHGACKPWKKDLPKLSDLKPRRGWLVSSSDLLNSGMLDANCVPRPSGLHVFLFGGLGTDSIICDSITSTIVHSELKYTSATAMTREGIRSLRCWDL